MIPHRFLDLDAYGVARLGGLDLLVLDLHGIHGLGEIGGVTLDVDGVSHGEHTTGYVDCSHPDFAKIGLNFPDLFLWHFPLLWAKEVYGYFCMLQMRIVLSISPKYKNGAIRGKRNFDFLVCMEKGLL
jgi:hypothetical protein